MKPEAQRIAIAEVSIDPPPREAGWVCLVDAKGKPCAYMGFELAAKLGWIENLIP